MISEITSPAKTAARPSWRDDPDTPLMVELPSGDFVMGENDGDKFANDTERPPHRVHMPYGISIGHCSVTVGEYRHFLSHHAPGEQEDLPVVNVTWHDARAYCAWLTRMTERAYRLPSEAEWEFACRAGSRAAFSWGDDITPSHANYLYDETGAKVGPGRRMPVGSYPPNSFGLCDFHGNVCEWVEDTWHPNYLDAPDDSSAWVNPADPGKVIRGGAWDYLPRLLRSPWRDWNFAETRRDNLGFRVATRSRPPA